MLFLYSFTGLSERVFLENAYRVDDIFLPEIKLKFGKIYSANLHHIDTLSLMINIA